MNKQQAMDKYCPMKLSSTIDAGDLFCHTDSCMAWREESCGWCSGKGYSFKTVAVEKNGKLKKERQEAECGNCDGSGVVCYCGMVPR